MPRDIVMQSSPSQRTPSSSRSPASAGLSVRPVATPLSAARVEGGVEEETLQPPGEVEAWHRSSRACRPRVDVAGAELSPVAVGEVMRTERP